MPVIADINVGNAVTLAAIAVGALVVFLIVHKIVKIVLSLVIAALLAAAAVFFCVKAGYISRETAEKLNPLNSEEVRQAVDSAGEWVGDKVKDAAKKAIDETIDEMPSRGK